MKYVKTNKIIAFILSMVIILSNVLPNISSNVFGLGNKTENNKSVEPVIEYSDSGQTEPERETTETDLDNFDFSLKYGTIEDEIENDSLFVKDQSNKINATLRIEYRGEQSYNAGDLSMTFNYPTGIYRNAPNYDMLSDVGAELKGSGSGRGDWYYEKELGKLTFTNKQATTGSFTSSIEIVLNMPNIRSVISGFESTMNASFNVNGFNSALNSKTLFFSTETTHDELELTKITASQFTYNTYSTDSSTYIYKGYKLDDFYIVNINFYYIWTLLKRGCNTTDTVTIPTDCIILESGSNVFSDKKNLSYSGVREDNCLTLAIPKESYNSGDKIPISWNKRADFFDIHETWEDTLNTEIDVLDCKINVQNLTSSSSKESSTTYIYTSGFGENKGVNFYWRFRLYSNPQYKNTDKAFEPFHTEITDENTYLDGSTSGNIKTRYFTEDEYYLKYIRISRDSLAKTDKPYTIHVFAKKQADSEYTLINSFVYNNEDINVDLDPSERYIHFKIVIDGDWAESKIYTSGSHYCFDIRVGAYCNLPGIDINDYFQIKNTANYKEVLNNGIEINKDMNANITLREATSRIRANINDKNSGGSINNYAVKDSKIFYKCNFYGNYILDTSTYDEKAHKISFDINIPNYFNFDFENGIEDQISLYGRVYNENDNALVSDKLKGYYDMDYNIKQENNDKILTITITMKEGYYCRYSPYSSYLFEFSFKSILYINLDTYTLLLNLGKLPNRCTIKETVYKEEDFPGYKWSSTTASAYAYLILPSLAGNTYQGVEKFVNIGSGFTKDLSATTPGGDYSYKLRIAGGETTLDNIVLYDNLEEAYGDNSYWKGTFNGLDTTLLDMICEGEDYNYTVYYSKDKNQAFDLSDAGWIKEADWTDALADVKSIAVDLGGIRLNPKSLAYVIVNMKAPENTNPGLKAYNSYAADYKAYDSATGTLMETIKALPSNTTEVIYNKNITYTVNKVWNGKASDSVEIKLFANGTEKETITLNADNKWTHTFTDLPALDDSFSPIEYTVEETALKLYNASYETVTDKDGNITTTIVNTRVPDIYTITKVWNINSEKIKLNVKTENGYDAEYDYINILDSDGSVLERIDFEKLGLVISKNEYKTDKTYTAEVHMKDGKVYKTSVNMDKFTKSPVECDLYVDGKVVDTFTLNEENGWKYTVTPSEKDNANAISLYSDDIIIDDDVIIVDPGDNPGGDDWEIHVYEDLDGVCSICGKTQEDGNHETIIDSDGDNTGTGNENTGSDNTGGDNTYHYHEYVDDNGICSVCGKTKDEGDHDKGVVHPKDEDDGIPEIPIDPHSVKEKTKGEWKTSITHTENGNNIDYTITNDVEHEIKIATITVSDPEPPVDTGNNNYLWIYFLTLGIGFAGILISRKKKQ